MVRIRRGNHVFVAWKGDHGPRHVHVYRDGRLLVRCDLDRDEPMEGQADTRIRWLVAALRREGKL